MQIAFIIIGTLTCVILLFFIIRYIIIISSIKKYSKLYLELTILNKKFSDLFYNAKENYKIPFLCNSLQKYQNRNNKKAIIKYLCEYFKEDLSVWKYLYENINTNKYNLHIYSNEYKIAKKAPPVTVTMKLKRKHFYFPKNNT